MDKEDEVYINNGMLFDHKKQILSFLSSWMELQDVKL